MNTKVMGTIAVGADVSIEAHAQMAAELVRRRFGRLDALVNNAGVATFKAVLETSPAEWQRVLDVNLTGPFLMTQACAPMWRSKRCAE